MFLLSTGLSSGGIVGVIIGVLVVLGVVVVFYIKVLRHSGTLNFMNRTNTHEEYQFDRFRIEEDP